MKAIQFLRAGGPEVVALTELPRPEPGPGEVRVRVCAASANPADCKVRDAAVAAMFGLAYPLVPGWEYSGVVDAAGPGVDGVAAGDEVVGVLASCGSFAEYVLASPQGMARKPAALSHVAAAALPAAGQTAWSALFKLGALERGQKVLIHAAAGGVGHLAVQLAHDAGAHVAGTASSAHHAFLRELGADELVDYRAQRFEEMLSDYDLVFDLMNGEIETRSWGVLKPGGLLVSALREIPPAEVPAGKRGVMVRGAPRVEDLTALMALAEAGRLRGEIRGLYPLERAAEAIELVGTGHGRGRVIVQVAES